MDHNDAIVRITHKSCAALAIQCLADSGITDWQTAFNQQITNAKKLGLMPDDFTEAVLGVLTVDFGEKGSRRLGKDWVQKHCSTIETKTVHKCQKIAQNER